MGSDTQERMRTSMRAAIEAAVMEADYDLYKGLFVEECMDDPEGAAETVERMIDAACAAMEAS